MQQRIKNIFFCLCIILFAIVQLYLLKELQRLKITETKIVLPDNAKCRLKMYYFRDASGDMMPGTVRMAYQVMNKPDMLCHWSMEDE